MTFDRQHWNVVYSISLFAGLCGIVMAVKWDTDFAALGLAIVTCSVAIAVGLFLILLRICKVNISKTNFIYTYFGVLNAILGLLTLGVILLYQNLTPESIFLILIQVIIAIFILMDIFKKCKDYF